MKKILIFMGHYLPGYKDGGPVRSIANLVDALGDEFEFRVVCLDRDKGDTGSYPNIEIDTWNSVGKAKVWYLSPGGFTAKRIETFSQWADIIYLCGFFDDYGYKTLFLHRFGALKKKSLAVASMGLFSVGALRQKSAKKKVFFAACKLLGLFKNITWSFTSEQEATEAKSILGEELIYCVAEDIPSQITMDISAKEHNNALLKIVFFSRISPKKNLLGAIKAMQQVHSEVTFDIYGPAEDREYWQHCKMELQKLPENVQWNYGGELTPEQVYPTLKKYDAFLFPTLGENFGHVIYEALAVGCIPIISDQTPWDEITERNAGFVLSNTDSMREYAECIDFLAQTIVDKRKTMTERAVQLAKDKYQSTKENNGYRKIFSEL